MGSCHVLMHEKLLEKIRQAPYNVIIEVLRVSEFEDDIYNVLIETAVLPDGYHGQQEIIVEDESVRFRRDTDT
jgi:hypothetical protein